MTFKFNRHSELEGRHAFLSPSKYHWINYDEEKVLRSYDKHMTAALGTRLHNWAAETIRLGVQMEDNSKTINMYVNDCIGFRMEVEVSLAYSINCFGTADAIYFGPNPDPDSFFKEVLRIWDLKNGVTPASMQQVKTYAAIFCLEYRIKPMNIDYDLRIYQNDNIEIDETDPEEIGYIMSQIVSFDKLIESYKEV